MERNITYIGGGVSTIFSIIKLLEEGYPGEKIIVIEKGNSIEERTSKEVMNGFGGGGSYSDFKCCYSLNQGGELKKYTGEEKGLELMKQVKKIIRKFHPTPELIETVTVKQEPKFITDSPFMLRQSEIEHLGTDFGQEILKNIYKYFKTKNINFHFRTEVLDIDFDKKIMKVVHYKKNGDFVKENIEFEKLIIAVGKSGTMFMKRLINKYHLVTSSKAMQIGVRVESDYKYFKKLAKDFYDFKLYKKINDNVSLRTFCINNERSYISVEKTFGMDSFNGHAYKDESKRNDLINFGIMVEIKGVDNPFEETLNLVKRCNEGGGGRYFTLGERKPTVKARKTTTQKFLELYNEYANHILTFIRELNSIFDFNNDYVLYLPEIKYLTKEIAVNKDNLELMDYKNIHIMGDAFSTRGIVPAACQGIYVAEFILK